MSTIHEHRAGEWILLPEDNMAISNGFPFHSQQLASSITRRGHEIITQSRDKIEALGYQVIYGDTDSLFVLLGPSHGCQSTQLIGQRLMNDLNTWWTKTLADMTPFYGFDHPVVVCVFN